MRALCRTTWLLPLLALPALACTNPVHSEAIDALGPEVGEDEGDEHRPGQPCLVCHGGLGPGEPDFSFGGTVYETAGSTAPAANVVVTIKDAKGREISRTTNDVGNFYVRREELDPTFPATVKLARGKEGEEMASSIGGTGSCADCHVGAGSRSKMPRVYMKRSP